MEQELQVDLVEVHYYPQDGSVFLDTHYLIKGVAGAIFWKLVREHSRSRRKEFSTRELRLAGRELRLPEVQDNLSARLILLQRRLAERGAAMQIHKTGRGRFRISVLKPMRLVEAASPGRIESLVPADDCREAPQLAAPEPARGQPSPRPATCAVG